MVTRLVYDEAGHILGEYDGTGKMVQETVYLGDWPVATTRSLHVPVGTMQRGQHGAD
ncbi:hypothetical protein JCM19000A_05670 [Silvimonas sp. JCM 19000]